MSKAEEITGAIDAAKNSGAGAQRGRRYARWLVSNRRPSKGRGLRYGSIMGLFKLLFQFAVVVAIVLFLQAADEQSLFGWIFDELDRASQTPSPPSGVIVHAQPNFASVPSMP